MALSTNRTLITQTGINTHQVLNVGGLDSAGIATFSNFKTGSTNVHSVGVEAAGINVLGGDTPIGAGSTIFDDGGARFIGIVTASGFSGDGSSLTGVASTDNIKTSTTANFTGGIQVGGSTTLTGALSATTATANLVVVGSAVTSNSQGIDVTGVVTATSFVGSGANLININSTSATGDFSIADKIIHTGDTNTAIRFPAADTITAETGNTERLRIDSVGTLLVAHSNQRNNFNSAVSTEHAPIIQLEGTNQRRAISITAANQDGGILMLARQNGSVGANTVVSSGNQIGRVDFQASGGTNMEVAAQITAEVDGTPGDNDMPGRLLFKTTADGANSASERLRIGSAGQIGVAGANYGESRQTIVSGGASAAVSWSSNPFLLDMAGLGDIDYDGVFLRYRETANVTGNGLVYLGLCKSTTNCTPGRIGIPVGFIPGVTYNSHFRVDKVGITPWPDTGGHRYEFYVIISDWASAGKLGIFYLTNSTN